VIIRDAGECGCDEAGVRYCTYEDGSTTNFTCNSCTFTEAAVTAAACTDTITECALYQLQGKCKMPSFQGRCARTCGTCNPADNSTVCDFLGLSNAGAAGCKAVCFGVNATAAAAAAAALSPTHRPTQVGETLSPTNVPTLEPTGIPTYHPHVSLPR
jgi:hypothetical protein